MLDSNQLWSFDPIATTDAIRAQALSAAPSPAEIRAAVAAAFHSALLERVARFAQEPARDKPTDHRIAIQFPVDAGLFDHFFNATTGYRGQFARSAILGAEYNAEIIDDIRSEIDQLGELDLQGWLLDADSTTATPASISKAFAVESLNRDWAKIWQCSAWISDNGVVETWMPEASGPRLELQQSTWPALTRSADRAWLDVRGAFLGRNGPYQVKQPRERARILHERGEA